MFESVSMVPQSTEHIFEPRCSRRFLVFFNRPEGTRNAYLTPRYIERRSSIGRLKETRRNAQLLAGMDALPRMRGPLRGRQSAQGQHRSYIIGLTFAGVAEQQDARTVETNPLSTFDTAETDPRRS